jgi:hypothetical protein
VSGRAARRGSWPRRARLGCTLLRGCFWALHLRRRLPHAHLPTLVEELRRAPRRGQRDAALLAAAVARIPRRVTGASQCLVRSLVLLRLCAENGHPAALVLGVAERTPPRAGFSAHAWVELVGTAARVPAGYAPLTRLP